MQELISVHSAPAKLAVNFEELKKHLTQELARYEVVVTAETLADAKKLAIELNQTAGLIDRRRKDEVAAVSEPIKKFDAQMKELVELCKGGRKKILDQVQRFEDETRERARALLAETAAGLEIEHGLEPEFRGVGYEDLVLLSSVTAKGNLAQSARHKLESRVREARALQDRTRMRLIELENASYKAGLAAPLTRDHVNPFLMADDERYAAELQRIMDAEKLREQEAERRMRERLEREARQKQEQEQAERARKEREAAEAAPAPPVVERAVVEPPVVEPQSDDEAPFEEEPFEEEEPAVHAGDLEWVVTATFETRVPAHLGRREIEAELRRVMAQAGITTLSAVEVVPKTRSSAA